MENIQLNKVFVITKGNRKMKWKIVEHPFFDCYTAVREHLYLHSGKCTREDMEHLNGGADTLEKAYEIAYNHT